MSTTAVEDDAEENPAARPTPVTFTVYGQPRPKGSMRHVGHGRMVEQLAGSGDWRTNVAHAAIVAKRQATPEPGPLFGKGTPVAVGVTFTFNPPASASRRRRVWPVTRTSGDIDKQCRNVLDALVDAGVMHDDSQVVRLHASKRHVGEAGALDLPGAVIDVSECLDVEAVAKEAS